MSTIELYTTGLHMEKNFVIDNITGFLNSANVTKVYTFLNFQYIRPEYEIAIKIDEDQSLLNRTKNPDFLALTQDNFVYYYYVNKVEQVAQKTLRFRCTMDVLNTYQGRYKLSANSLIERQHVDRFTKVSSTDLPDRTTINMNVVPSRTEEKMSPALYKTADRVITGSDVDVFKWYLVYRTDEVSGNPTLSLYPEIQISIDPDTEKPSVEYEMLISDYNKGTYYYVKEPGYTLTSGTVYMQTNNMVTVQGGYSQITIVTNTENNKDGFYIIGYDSNNNPFTIPEGNLYQSTRFKTYIANNKVLLKNATRIYYSFESVPPATIESLPYIYIGSSGKQLNSIKTVNLLDPKITKIIECPYCPIDASYIDGSLIFDTTQWTYDTQGCLRAKNVFAEFNRSSIGQVELKQGSRTIVLTKDSMIGTDYGIFEDPKSRNTNICQDVLVYDNASYVIPYETAKTINNRNPKVNISYKQTNNMTSALMFQVEEDETTSIIEEQYFDKLLISNRNNEIPLYTSEYINYLNMGYNYDKKRIDLQQEQRSSNIAFQGIKSIGEVVSSYASGGAAGAAVAAGGATLSLIQSGVANHYANQQAELNLAQKINSLQNTSFSVSTVDNLALFNKYSSNKLHLMKFEPIPEVVNMINKYFSLFGYTQGFFEIPNTDSRYAFNYVRGDVDVDGDDFKQPYFDAKDRIAEKYKGGVYFIHNRAATPTFWDLDLATVNYETALLPESWI